MDKAVPLGDLPSPQKKRRLGFMLGQQPVPSLEEFNSIAEEDIEKMFDQE